MRKGIGPRGLGSPLKQTMSKKKEPIAFNKTSTKKPQDPNVFTDTYNAATGEYNDPYYNPARAKQYEKNAIDKYGSLEASREATRINYPHLTEQKRLQKPIIRGGNKLKPKKTRTASRL